MSLSNEGEQHAGPAAYEEGTNDELDMTDDNDALRVDDETASYGMRA